MPVHGLLSPIEPRYPVEDLLSLVNPDIRKPFDMLEVLLRIVDDSRLSVFKPKYGTNMITAWAHIQGTPINTISLHYKLTDIQASLSELSPTRSR